MQNNFSSSLPIHALRDEFCSACKTSNRIILQAPTGSGKSTQIPQILLDQKIIPEDKKIIVLQPRRLATRMLAKRIAQERGESLGMTAGYQIRFEKVESNATRIKFVTEGLLFRQLLSGRQSELNSIGAIIFDEFHERHIYSDVTLALAKKIQETSLPNLLIIVMSATLETKNIEQWLSPCKTLQSDGRSFPVDIHYSSFENTNTLRQTQMRNGFLPKIGIWDKATLAFKQSFQKYPDGDFLIFMPGAYEIIKTISAIENTPEGKQCEIYPLYGELSPKDQDKAVSPNESTKRKIIVATNVAETSLTIPGIKIVIDSGLARYSRYDPHRDVNMLLIENISTSSANQRAGRAGRIAPGICIRLWSKTEQDLRPAQETPEIERIEISEILLLLKRFGIKDLKDFPWFEPPTEKSLNQGIKLLKDLNALTTESEITNIGEIMTQFPLHPRYSKMLIEAQNLDCVKEISIIVAFLQGKDFCLLKDNKWNDEEDSDLLLRLSLFKKAEEHNFDINFCKSIGIHTLRARQTQQLSQIFINIASKQKTISNTPLKLTKRESIIRCIISGFISNLSTRLDLGTLRCNILHSRRGELSPESVVKKNKCFVASEINEIQTKGTTNVILSLATKVEKSDLYELYPKHFNTKKRISFDFEQKKIITFKEECFLDLPLESKLCESIPNDETASILTKEIISGRLKLENWNYKVEERINKINFAAKHCPELNISPIDESGKMLIIEEICRDALSLKDLENKSILHCVNEWLSYEQKFALDSVCPDFINLPKKKHPAKIEYTNDGDAIIAATVQELYDANGKDLKICNKSYPLIIEIQSPARRTFQRTNDLDAFWKTSYENVKKELKGRYPKHEWR